MVKALLAKKSMGLIKLAPSEKGPDVFRRMMNPSHYIAAQPEAESSADDMPAAAQFQIKDQMHFDPRAAADKDESMVNNLLDAVAGLGGKQHKKLALLRKRHRTESADPFAEDMAAFGVDEQPKPAPPPAMEAPEVEEKAEVAPKKKTNSYLAGLDMSGDMPVAIEPAHAKSFRHTHTQNLLESDESLSFQSVAEAELAAPKAQKVVVQKPNTDNSFMNWLGMTKKAPASQEEKAVKGNPYSALLS